MRLRSQTRKDHQGRCADLRPCPAKRSRNNLQNEFKSATLAMVHESPGPSRNKNKKIEPFDSKSASSFKLLEDQFVPLSSLPAAQAAFSIAKVRKKIFSFMNPRELLQLRLVSRDWRRDATNGVLLNWDKNVISLSKNTYRTSFLSSYRYKYQQFWDKTQDLTALMNKTGSYPFPCSQFKITLTNWKDEKEIQSFLTTHGYRIHKLTFSLCYEENCEEMAHAKKITERYKICSHQENWLFQNLAKLLFDQAPNLQKIKISFISFGTTGVKPCKPIVDNFIIDQTPQVFHTKLRSAKISRNISLSVFDYICRIAPNLTDFKCKNLNYYLDPINRLYLLKDLAYFPHSNIFEAENKLLIKRIANTVDKLNVHKLWILFPLWSSEVPEDWSEVTDIINKLLEKSCHSLKKLKMNAAEFLPGLKFPRMSNVHAIVFLGCLPNDGQRHFLPREICLSDTFPKLTNLHIKPYIDRRREGNNFDNDDFFLISSNKKVVFSVREIKANLNVEDFGLEKYQRWFPNAKFVDYKHKPNEGDFNLKYLIEHGY